MVVTVKEQKDIIKLSNLAENMNSLLIPPIVDCCVSYKLNSKSLISSTLTFNCFASKLSTIA